MSFTTFVFQNSNMNIYIWSSWRRIALLSVTFLAAVVTVVVLRGHWQGFVLPLLYLGVFDLVIKLLQYRERSSTSGEPERRQL